MKGGLMRLVSRLEEIILLAVCKLEGDAYGVAILEEIRKGTGKTWLTGSIYAGLGRLLKHGLVDSYEGDPVPERGGRRKIYYRLTPDGLQALKEVRRISSAIWTDVPLFEARKK
jgi:DNA-binding PadR family transcriptional regulator